MSHKNNDSHDHPHDFSNITELASQLRTSTAITQEQRNHMIAEAAYYIAEIRHFKGGDPLHDWLLAQAEIDKKLKGIPR